MSKGMNSALKVSLFYFIFSALWIFFSDRVLLIFFTNVEEYKNFSTVKGMLFVLISALLIYHLVSRELKLLKEANTNIERYKTRDTLTGLYNRDNFYKKINSLIDADRKISLLVSDINGLKFINEVYSSMKGDEVLIQYSSLLRKLFPNDFIARIGGDEFAVIFYNCSYEEVEKQSTLLLKSVQGLKVDEFSLSVSIGYSTACHEEHNVNEALALAEDRMLKNKLLITKSASNSVLTSIKATLFERSDETELHASRMINHCEILGEKFKLSHSDVSDLKLLAILHDIGKIGISDSILKKKGKLTEIEYNKMKQHTEIGYKMASSINPLKGVAYYILTHHERVDGTGYPNGLSGNDIPLLSRILSVVDAYDAMTNDRIYRKAMSIEDAIDEIVKNRGTQFDTQVVDTFIDVIKKSSSI